MPASSRPALVCFDIAGTLTEGSAGPPLPGAVDAVRCVREQLPVRFVTNVTSRSHAELVSHLGQHGMLEDPGELVTPARAAQRVLEPAGVAGGI